MSRPPEERDGFVANPLDEGPIRWTITDADARSGLVIALTQMPQAAATQMELITDYDALRLLTEPDFLSMIEEWVSHYAGVVATMKTTAASMASELAELRNQRAAIRSFLGTTPGES